MLRPVFVFVVAALTLATSAAEPVFVFRDVAAESGLLAHIKGIMGHAGGWGDVDGDGKLDLYVGTFRQAGGGPNILMRQVGGKFEPDPQMHLRVPARCSAAIFVDFDNDGDLDLYMSSMPHLKLGLAGCKLFRNDGKGAFTDVSFENGACAHFGGRAAAAMDYDGDGLADLLVGEDPRPGYNGGTTKRSRIFRNLGNLRFAETGRDIGLPDDVPGLGVAAADVNGDTLPDFFIACMKGGNRLFLNKGKSWFVEAPGTRELFDWTKLDPKPVQDDTPCGVCIADVNNDGLPDIVVGHHYDRPWPNPVRNRLYLNRGVKDGNPVFEDVTERAGLTPLTMKGPQVEVHDFDNDGLPDIYVSIVVFAAGKPHPVIFRNLGNGPDGIPRFEQRALGLNDFPTAQDLAIKRTGDFFDKMIADKKILYGTGGPTADYDDDGRVDIFLTNWWIKGDSLLLHNETPGGHWLKVQVRAGAGVNRDGIGTVVRIYRAGKLGEPAALLGCKEIAVGYGYTAGQEAVAHFGLGKVEEVDIEATLPHNKGKLVQRGVKVDRRLTLGP